MLRALAVCLLTAIGSLAGWSARAERADNSGSDSPPLTYELLVNGESFLVEANRRVTLKSRTKPGVVYDVALQIAMEQHVRLDHLQLDYDWPATVQESRRGARRTVRIRHELGFTLILSDLGQATDVRALDEALRLVADTVSTSLQESGMKILETGTPHKRSFSHCSGLGLRVRYEDKEGTAQTCLVYLVAGTNFAASCVIQYFDANAENSLPRVKKILDSIRPSREDSNRPQPAE